MHRHAGSECSLRSDTGHTFNAETFLSEDLDADLLHAGRELLGKGSQAWHCARDIADYFRQASLTIDFIAAEAKVTREDVALFRIDVHLDLGIESNVQQAAVDITERRRTWKRDPTLLTIRSLRAARLLQRSKIEDIVNAFQTQRQP